MRLVSSINPSSLAKATIIAIGILAQNDRISHSHNGVASAAAQQHIRPGSSLGVNARRVTVEEKERQDVESKLEYKSEPPC
jgi:hypothetical protein